MNWSGLALLMMKSAVYGVVLVGPLVMVYLWLIGMV